MLRWKRKKNKTQLDYAEKDKQIEESTNSNEDVSENKIQIRKRKKSGDLYEAGKGSLWDIICPDGIDLSHPDHGMLQDSLNSSRPFRSIYITKAGWPRKLRTDWLSAFTRVGEVDLTVYVEKVMGRQAIQSLQNNLTMLKANYRSELKRGNIDQIHDLETKIRDTEALLEDTSLGENDLFHASVQANIFGDNHEILERVTNYLDDDLGGSHIHVRSAFNRMKSGFLSVLPRGKNEMNDTYRNLDRRSLSTLFPFASSELRYKGGFPFAVNQDTGNLVFLNLFAEDHNNYNMICFGESGSGKSFAIKTLVGRSLLQGCHSVLLDPEGEYRKFTKRLGGTYIKLSFESSVVINPCAISVTEVEMDEDDEEQKHLDDGKQVIEKDGKLYVRFVPVKEKINEIVDFIEMLIQKSENDHLDTFEEDFLEISIRDVFQKKGITPDPNSLYEEEPKEKDGEIYHELVQKEEVTLSDIYQELESRYGDNPKTERLLAGLRPWLKNGSRGIFDGQTNFGEGISTDIDNQKIVTFDVSELEEGRLRRIGYHVCLTWIWQKFVKSQKNSSKEKIVVADEFWQMIDSPLTVNFSEKMGRRCRKRNTSFVIASQDAERVLNNEKAKGIVTNSTIQLFLKQNSINLNLMRDSFDLSQGELSVVMGKPKKGEGILRTQNESVWIRTDPHEYEKILFESNEAKLKELEQQIETKMNNMA